LATQLFESKTGRINCQLLANNNTKAKTKLIEFKALSGPHIDDNPCIVDEDDNIVDVVRNQGKWQYFDRHTGWSDVAIEEISHYKLRHEWLFGVICRELDIQTSRVQEVIKDFLWLLGDAVLGGKKSPIFITKCNHDNKVLEQIYQGLQQRHGLPQGIILSTSTTQLPVGVSLPGDHKLLLISDCLTYSSNNFHLDRNMLASQVGGIVKKDGFSSGFKSACFNGNNYKFTPLESSVLEYLFKAGNHVHKDEVMAYVTDSKMDIKRLFKNADSKGVRHTILHYDNKGFYWLDDLACMK
jgi:hypothetical protein